MIPNIGDMVKKMQEDMQRAKATLVNITVEGTAGGGMVKVTANCQNQIVRVEVEKEVVDPEDKEMLEDLIVAATNQALEKAATKSQEEMQKIVGPMMNFMPPGFKLPGM